MKKVIFSIISVCMLIASCNSQTSLNNNVLSLMKYVKKDYVDILTYTVIKNTTRYKFVIPYYEFSVSDIKIGDACIFAISKDFPQRWVDQAMKLPKGECNKKDGYKESFYIKCEARHLLGSDTINLKKNFDIYIFFIDRKELDGPFIEVAEGGSSENYTPKKGSTILTYKFDGVQWQELERNKLTNDDNLRVIGSRVVKKIADKKIEEYRKSI
jgi:hypothetical protein